MGPMGVYRLFSTGGGGAAGGMMTKPAQVAHPHWRFAFQVQSVHAAAPRITSGGGQLVNRPMEVPGGQWTLQATDPQGAFFSLLSNER
jgi:predicted enzyme related to lactoylglutathione lyase